MNNRLYKLMNWPDIEAIVYAESINPGAVLGPHSAGNSTLFQTFIPGAKEVRLRFPSEDKSIKMEQVDENGFFVLLNSGKLNTDYEYIAEYPDGKIAKIIDAYQFTYKLDTKALKDITLGKSNNAYEILGAHVTTINKHKGVLFTVWAPNARRVSVVGEFNNWDGRMHQMNKDLDTGVFSIFMPGVQQGDEYLYEIDTKGGLTKTIIDPYSVRVKDTDGWFASVVCDLNEIEWTDASFLKNRDKDNVREAMPFSIYECSLAYYAQDMDKPTYSEIGAKIIEHVKNIRYTHVELKPIAEYENEDSLGYETIGYYAPTSRYGSFVDFAKMIDDFHKAGIKVILDWTLAHPSSNNYALRNIDGTGCYEHEDPRQGIHPQWGTLLFDYGRGEVVSFLKSNALYWINVFHIDGIRIDSLAPIICLDYGRTAGDWIPNTYGGRENLDALEFLKNLNMTISKTHPGVVTIAEDSSAWQKVTETVQEGGLGFTYKWNIGWREDYLKYIGLDPLFRGGSHNELTLSMIYFYSDRFILPLTADSIQDSKLSIAYMMTHPGAKLIGQGLDDSNKKSSLEKMIKALNQLYMKRPALYKYDDVEEGFEWINCMDSERCTLSFMRKGKTNEDTLIVVANFSGIAQSIDVGIAVPGKYNRIFNTDATTYGGTSKVKEDPIYTIDEDVDSRPYYIPVTLPALSLSVFEYIPFDENDREYMMALQQETKKKAEEARELAKKEEVKAERARRKAESEQKKAEEAARIAEEARKKAEEEYKKAEAELAKAYAAMEKAKEAAARADRAAHRLEVAESVMKK